MPPDICWCRGTWSSIMRLFSLSHPSLRVIKERERERGETKKKNIILPEQYIFRAPSPLRGNCRAEESKRPCARRMISKEKEL